MNCVVPVRVRLVGRPTDEDLLRLEDAVARLVTRQLRAGQQALQEGGPAGAGGEEHAGGGGSGHVPPPTRQPIQRLSDVRADPVRDLEQVDGVWQLKLEGYTEAGAVVGYIWPSGPPPYVRVVPLVVVEKPVQMGLFELTGVTVEALSTMEPGLAKQFAAKGLGSAKVEPPSPKTQYLEFEVTKDPARPGEFQLTSTPVNQRPDYIDAQMTYLRYGIYLGGFDIWVGELDTRPIFISNRYLEDRMVSVSVGDRIFDSIDEANASVVANTRPGDNAPRHAYYWGAGGMVIAPTIFSVATTPRIMATLYQARAELARLVQRELASYAGYLVISRALRVLDVVYRRAQKAFTDDPAPPRPVEEGPGPSSGTSAPRAATQGLAPKPSAVTPKAPAPPPRTLSRATTDDVAQLKNEGFVYEGTSSDGRMAVYRNPTTGQRATITLNQGGAAWMNPAWGRNRLEAELRNRGFTLDRQTWGEGGLEYRNAATGERIRIMPRPRWQNRVEAIEKHLNSNYYRYRPSRYAKEGDHTTIPDKD